MERTSGLVEAWAEQAGRAKRKSAPGGEWRPWEPQDTPQGWAHGQKEKRLHAGQPGTQPYNLLCVARLPILEGAPAAGREKQGRRGEDTACGENKEVHRAYTAGASARQHSLGALRAVARFSSMSG